MKFNFTDLAFPKKGAIAVFVNSTNKLSGSALKIDMVMGGALKSAIDTGRFQGNSGQIIEILAPSGLENTRVLAIGIGKEEALSERFIEEIGGSISSKLLTSGEECLFIAADNLSNEYVSSPIFASRIASGLEIRSYRFDKYRTKEDKNKKQSLMTIIIGCEAYEKAKESFDIISQVNKGLFLTRDLISEPANVIYPESYAKIIKQLEGIGLEVDILGEAQLEKIGMRALLGVGQGSARDSQVVIMKWNGATDKKEAPICFVGKGVTFDTGGISLKPGLGMEDMKWDMGGSAIVVGAMKAFALRKAKANIWAIVGLVENMPSSKAQRPGDVVKSLSGQTIEIINTDAEGRLVLADILWYAQEQFKPKLIIDLATLTGAIVVSLGKNQYSGFFSNSDEISSQLIKAGNVSGDKTWRMPLSEEYDEIVDSQIADMRNACGSPAGSITAAQFLQRFVNKVPWAHIDVAGVVWSAKEHKLWEKGATGYGVRLLDRFISENYES
ncbi:MAG: leucyl aminopeptidase [Sphingomonadales bacterium]